MRGRRAAVRGLWLAAAWLPALLLIALPLAGFLAYSLFRVEGSEIVHEPGLANYARFFGEGVFLPVFLRTCLLAAEVAPDLATAARRAEAALDSGAARAVLERLVTVSRGGA